MSGTTTFTPPSKSPGSSALTPAPGSSGNAGASTPEAPADLPLPATDNPAASRDLLWQIAWRGVANRSDAPDVPDVPGNASSSTHAAQLLADARTVYEAFADTRLAVPESVVRQFEAFGTWAGDQMAVVVPAGPHGPDVALDETRKVRQSGAAVTFDLSAIAAAGPAHGGPLEAWRRIDAEAGSQTAAVYVRADHPDIGDLVRAAGDLRTRLLVGVTDDLLDALARGAEYDLIEPTTGTSAGTRRARAAMDRIAERLWAGNGGAIIFVDRLFDADPRSRTGARLIPSARGGQPLEPSQSTVGLELDLTRHIVPSDNGAQLDDQRVSATTRAAALWLPRPSRHTLAQLDVTGIARAAFRLGIPYADEAGRAQVVRAARLVRTTLDAAGAHGVRIAAPLLAPLHSLSQVRAPGIPPAIAREFVQAARAAGFWHEGLVDQLLASGGSARSLSALPAFWRAVFAVGAEVAASAQLHMQVAVEEQVGGATMGPVVLRTRSQPSDVVDLVRDAATLGCHALSVSRQVASERDQTVERQEVAQTPRLRARPDILRSTTHKLEPGCGTLYVTIGADEQGPVEVITVRARGNACSAANLEATSRIAGLALRAGVPVETVAQALRGVRCGEPVITPHATLLGCVDAIGQALERHALGEDGPQHEVFHDRRLDDFGSNDSL